MMATKHICDICGFDIPPKSICGLTIEDSIPALFGNGHEHICGGEKNFDLCQSCFNDIVNYIKNRQDGYSVYYFMGEVDFKPIVHTRWKNGDGIYDTCMACNEEIYQAMDMNYCPNCGAKFEER